MGPVVVMYHDVLGDEPGQFNGLKGVRVSEFEAQLNSLCSRMEPIVHLDLLHAARERSNLPDNCFYLTFDHATRDHIDVVLPVLQKQGLTAEFFPMTLPLVEGKVPTVDKQRFVQYVAYREYRSFLDAFCAKVLRVVPEVDLGLIEPSEENINQAATYLAEHDFYSLEERFYRYIRNEMLSGEQFARVIDQMFADFYPDERAFAAQFYMNFDDLRAMQAAGMIIGGHSHSHPLFSKLPPEEVQWEIAQSHSILSEKLNVEIESFSYPFGDFDSQAIKIVKANHIAYAFATGNRIVEQSDDLHSLPRLDAASLGQIVL